MDRLLDPVGQQQQLFSGRWSSSKDGSAGIGLGAGKVHSDVCGT